MLLGINSKLDPTPSMVKKMILVLISANSISHSTTVHDSSDGKGLGGDAHVVTKALLGYSHRQGLTGIQTYAMFDGYYWYRIKLAHPTSE